MSALMFNVEPRKALRTFPHKNVLEVYAYLEKSYACAFLH